MYASLLCALVFNGFRAPGSPPKGYEDFMLRTPEEAQRRSTANMVAALRALAVPAKKPPKFKRAAP